jgi:hypothetical protein
MSTPLKMFDIFVTTRIYCKSKKTRGNMTGPEPDSVSYGLSPEFLRHSEDGAHRSTLVITNTSSMAVTITRRTSRIRFLSHMTKFALSRVKGSRDFSIRKSVMASSLLNTPLSTRISPVVLFSKRWCPTQKGLEYLLFIHRSNSSCSDNVLAPT